MTDDTIAQMTGVGLSLMMLFSLVLAAVAVDGASGIVSKNLDQKKHPQVDAALHLNQSAQNVVVNRAPILDENRSPTEIRETVNR